MQKIWNEKYYEKKKQLSFDMNKNKQNAKYYQHNHTQSCLKMNSCLISSNDSAISSTPCVHLKTQSNLNNITQSRKQNLMYRTPVNNMKRLKT